MNNDLIIEANVLLKYITSESPSEQLIDRYINAVMEKCNRKPIKLPKLFILAPWAINFFEPVGRGSSDNQRLLVRRIQIAVSIAESTTEYFEIFCLIDKKSKIKVLFEFFIIGLQELLFMPFRIVCNWVYK